MRALVVEDEEALRFKLVTLLKRAGYAVDEAVDGREALYVGKEYPIDIAVVDIGLPQMDGIEVIKHWRNEGKSFPVLILTARGRWQDKVDGLEAGADDYLVKPFNDEELVARMRALLRRSSGFASNTIKCGPIKLNTRSHELVVNDQNIVVTAFEYKVLEYMILNAGKVISKSELAEHIYNEDEEKDSNVLEVIIGRLRKKIDPEREFNPIETRRGEGYRFTIAPEQND